MYVTTKVKLLVISSPLQGTGNTLDPQLQDETTTYGVC